MPGSGEAWTPAHARYGEKVAIGLAVEIQAGQCHPSPDSFIRKRAYLEAARHLGASGAGRVEVLSDLVGLLALHGVEPIPMVRRAVRGYE